jgi:putative oxidoreductase
MKTLLFATNNNNLAATIARTTIGTVLLAHGAQKLLGWFGGYGFEGTMRYFTGTAALPWLVGFLVIVIEFFGSLSLIIGFATRIWSIAIFILTLGIIETVHFQFGFFMNWFGNQKGEGFEYFLLMLGLAGSLIFSGGGMLSVDSFLVRKKRDSMNQQVTLVQAEEKAA